MARKKFVSEERSGVVIVTLLDEAIIDMLNILTLRDQLADFVEKNPEQGIIIDFRRVKFLSTAMLDPLIKLQRKINANGGRLVFCGMDRQIVEVFEHTKLDRLFKIITDRKTAIDGLSS